MSRTTRDNLIARHGELMKGSSFEERLIMSVVFFVMIFLTIGVALTWKYMIVYIILTSFISAIVASGYAKSKEINHIRHLLEEEEDLVWDKEESEFEYKQAYYY